MLLLPGFFSLVEPLVVHQKALLSLRLKHQSYLFFNIYKVIYFIYLFLAALGLHCCPRAFSGCAERGLLFVVVRGLLIVVAFLVVERRF